uniref:Uncharacterized protein n=1 Tax=Pristionchus pacificus TaxID=54126 RepID=A0A2A6BR17_PRIPA|eukprot:PDM68359.1 hypothetical protein PRIPAC_46403 [Pristionchus pacificus]
MGQIGRRVIDGSIDGSMGLFIRRIIPTTDLILCSSSLSTSGVTRLENATSLPFHRYDILSRIMSMMSVATYKGQPVNQVICVLQEITARPIFKELANKTIRNRAIQRGMIQIQCGDSFCQP